MKQRKSKLDQYAATLLDMDAARKTLEAMQTWLKGEGCVISISSLGSWLALRRQQLLQERLLGQIASGARQCQAVEKQFGKNPAPELETLIKLHRVLILQLSTQGNADPEYLKLADQLTNTVMSFISGQTKHRLEEKKLGLQERRVSLLEKKAAQADATDKVLSNQQLTPQEREQRIREIYGRS